jgi:hypothetical protein
MPSLSSFQQFIQLLTLNTEELIPVRLIDVVDQNVVDFKFSVSKVVTLLSGLGQVAVNMLSISVLFRDHRLRSH